MDRAGRLLRLAAPPPRRARRARRRGGGPDLAGLLWLTRASAVVFLATGGYLAGERCTGSALLGTDEGRLVVAMVVLWLVLTGLVELLASRLRGRLGDGRAPPAGATTLVRIAGLLALALLVVGGLLAV